MTSRSTIVAIISAGDRPAATARGWVVEHRDNATIAANGMNVTMFIAR